MDNNQNTLQKHIWSLPQAIQESMAEFDFNRRFDAIAKKYQMSEEQRKIIETETLIVLLGIDQIKNFIPNIARALDIEIKNSEIIAEDINTEIFEPLEKIVENIDIDKQKNEHHEITLEKIRESIKNSPYKKVSAELKAALDTQ